MGRLNRSSCRSFIKVSSDRQRSGLSFLMKIDILPIFMVHASRSCSGKRAFALRASDFIFNAHFFSKRNEPKKILLSPNPFLHIKGLNWKSQEPPIFRFFSGRIDRQRSILAFLMKIDILPIFMVHTSFFLFVLLFKRIRLSYDFVFNAYHQRDGLVF